MAFQFRSIAGKALPVATAIGVLIYISEYLKPKKQITPGKIIREKTEQVGEIFYLL